VAEVDAQSKPAGQAYRPDIDGLRGLAVLLVVLWHANVPGVGGGYVGVDAFFVISGYVITGSLQRDAGAGGLSILGFYARRLRRIAPAFLVMLAIVLAVSFAIALPAELVRTASVALGALLLSANFVLWRESGYFGHGADTEPLRHVWSLSIEEQFYLVYPALLALLLARAPKAAGAALAALAALSLAAFLVLYRSSPEAAYELGPARAWELLAGCVCALQGGRWRLSGVGAEALALAGAGLIAAAALGQAHGAASTIVIASLGAVLLVLGGERRPLVSRLLAAPPLRFVGLASYSLYLWHWPLLAFATSLRPTGIGWMEKALLLTATALLGFLSWRFVERPLRRPWQDGRARRRFLAICGALALCAAGASALALVGQGWPARFPPSVARLAAFEDYRGTSGWRRQFRPACFVERMSASGYDQRACLTAAPGRRNVLLWGDSHAAELAGPLSDAAARLGAHLMQATMANCVPAPHARAKRPGCDRFNDIVHARLKTQPADVVVISVSALSPARGLPEEVDALTASGAKVILVGPTPQYTTLVAPVLARAWPATPDLSPWTLPQPFEADAQFAAQFAARRGMRYVSAIDLFCPSGRCALLTPSGAPLIWDHNHLTPEAAQALVRRLSAPLAEDLAAPGPAPSVRSP
jgi:peptidoglycan/LPS O-acetylase OafA/YrhL